MAAKAHLEGNKRYHDKFDVIRFRVPKGDSEKIKVHAESLGIRSLNSYILSLIEKDMNT